MDADWAAEAMRYRDERDAARDQLVQLRAQLDFIATYIRLEKVPLEDGGWEDYIANTDFQHWNDTDEPPF